VLTLSRRKKKPHLERGRVSPIREKRGREGLAPIISCRTNASRENTGKKIPFSNCPRKQERGGGPVPSPTTPRHTEVEQKKEKKKNQPVTNPSREKKLTRTYPKQVIVQAEARKGRKRKKGFRPASSLLDTEQKKRRGKKDPGFLHVACYDGPEGSEPQKKIRSRQGKKEAYQALVSTIENGKKIASTRGREKTASTRKLGHGLAQKKGTGNRPLSRRAPCAIMRPQRKRNNWRWFLDPAPSAKRKKRGKKRNFA